MANKEKTRMVYGTSCWDYVMQMTAVFAIAVSKHYNYCKVDCTYTNTKQTNRRQSTSRHKSGLNHHFHQSQFQYVLSAESQDLVWPSTDAQTSVLAGQGELTDLAKLLNFNDWQRLVCSEVRMRFFGFMKLSHGKKSLQRLEWSEVIG